MLVLVVPLVVATPIMPLFAEWLTEREMGEEELVALQGKLSEAFSALPLLSDTCLYGHSLDLTRLARDVVLKEYPRPIKPPRRSQLDDFRIHSLAHFFTLGHLFPSVAKGNGAENALRIMNRVRELWQLIEHAPFENFVDLERAVMELQLWHQVGDYGLNYVGGRKVVLVKFLKLPLAKLHRRNVDRIGEAVWDHMLHTFLPQLHGSIHKSLRAFDIDFEGAPIWLRDPPVPLRHEARDYLLSVAGYMKIHPDTNSLIQRDAKSVHDILALVPRRMQLFNRCLLSAALRVCHEFVMALADWNDCDPDWVVVGAGLKALKELKECAASSMPDHPLIGHVLENKPHQVVYYPMQGTMLPGVKDIVRVYPSENVTEIYATYSLEHPRVQSLSEKLSSAYTDVDVRYALWLLQHETTTN